MSSRSDYVSALAAMYGRAASVHKLGLAKIEAALQALGRPQTRMKHVVVAGTNGKGSTSTLIAGALSAAGHRVGHYTSPHLLRFTERIRMNGREITPERVVALYRRIEPLGLSFFEIATVMALLAFAEDGVDIAVLEVGLGGRLDATNVVDKHLSVITPVGIDHEQYLGSTLEEIAYEKAGIIAPGVPVVVSAQDAIADTVIRKRAAELGAPVHDATHAPVDGLRIPQGSYQRGNVATAALACRLLGVAEADIARSCARFSWPGRYQWIDDVLLDGAHNGHGVRALLDALDADVKTRGRDMHLVATVLADKDPAVVLTPLAVRARSVRLVPVGSKRSRSVEALRALGWPAMATMAEALRDARARDGYSLVAGSLFLVADALASLTGAERDPPVDA